MELWMDLLFGNPIGLFSMIAIFGTMLTGIVLGIMFIVKSHKKSD